jgi:hypothetical protein
MLAEGWDIAEPRADALIESLRAFGYTPEAAIADLVDNSVSAGAKQISVQFTWAGPESTVSVQDDGAGMAEDVLLAAMRPGSTSPLADRDEDDLGRFGLGLKTASFSQARELTVVSVDRMSRRLAVRRWDLDTVASSGEWRLLRSNPAGVEVPPPPSTGGTTVVWSKLDRLVGEAGYDDPRAQRRFLGVARRVQRHLEATFHRFLVGRNKITISVNGNVVTPWDPFLINHPATQRFDVEELPYRGLTVRVSPFVLPHRSKLSEEQAQLAAGVSGWNQQQGFYVYRSGRLLVQGDWLGLGLSKDEHTKLARLAVEFPAALDHDWHVDVKKASARPPGELVEPLRRIARATRTRAEEVYRYKGKMLARRNSQSFVFAWLQEKDRNGALRFRINRKHPVIVALMRATPQNRKVVERAIRFIEETVPTTMIGVSIAESLDTQPAPFAGATREIRPLVEFLYGNLVAEGTPPNEAIDSIAATEPFIYFPEVIQAFRETQT